MVNKLNIQLNTIKNTYGFDYVTRIEWDADPSDTNHIPNISIPLPYVFVAHTVGAFCSSRLTCRQVLRDIQSYHKYELHWNDIGYNFLVGGDGAIYEGRGWAKEGAHTYGYNKKSIGIGFIGNYMKIEPTQRQIDNTLRLLNYGLKEGLLAKDYKVLGQRQVQSTQSPGENLMAEIKTWAHWVPEP